MEQVTEKHEKRFRVNVFRFFIKLLKWFFIINVIWFALVSIYDFFTKFELRGIFLLSVFGLGYYLYVRKTGKNPILGYFSKTKGKAVNKEFPNVLNLNGSVNILNPFSGIFICGGAGSGKSKSIIEPLIKEGGKKGYTGVIYDFKYPELGKYVATAYKNSEVKSYNIDFINAESSHRVNPIAPGIMNSIIKAQELAYSVMVNLDDGLKSNKGDNFFSQSAVSLLSACMWYLRQNYPEYCTLPHAISMIVYPNSKKLIEKLASYHATAEMISPILSAYTNGAEKQLAGQLASAQLPLQKINTPNIFWVLSESDLDLNLNSVENRSVLTIGNNPSIQDSLSPVIALVLTSTMKLLNQPGKEKSFFMVDEFPTIYIPNVEQLPATARSNRVATILACQDIAQIVDKYGKEKADTILSNLGNQFYGRTTNVQTAERVSKIFGKYDKRKINRSYQLLSTKSRTESYQESDLVKATEVMQTNTGTFYTLLSEGANRLGVAPIKMDESFKKSEIVGVTGVTMETINDNFDQIKDEIRTVVLA